MRVFKFGGASVKNAAAVRNVGKVLEKHTTKPTVVVISAMGKTTNNMEALAKAYYENSPEKKAIFQEIKAFHMAIIEELISDENDFYEVDNLFIELECHLEKSIDKKEDYNYTYDQIVPFGELISTKIVSIYLSKSGHKNRWIDARNFVITDTRHRNASINWETSSNLIQTSLKPLLQKQTIITQGFIGRGSDLSTTTLGREGSDYTASIFAHCLEAESVTIWKDVDGVMNGDPKRFGDAVLIPELSYNEAIELAYYGASVIHPKTIQPLKSKGIPLFVKSFIDTNKPGTKVFENDANTLNDTQCFIVKENQSTLHIYSRDFSFIVEDNLIRIFSAFAKANIQINVMQNTAISFTACFNSDEMKTKSLVEALSDRFRLETKSNLTLFTIFNYDGNRSEIKALKDGKKPVMEQQTRNTLQLVIA